MDKKEEAALIPTVSTAEGQPPYDCYESVISYEEPKHNTPDIKFFSEIEVAAVDWLWYPYIPFGKVTIIQGDPGEGKTTLALNIAAILSRGERLPTELEYTYTYDSITSIYQTAEDGLADTIKPRLTAADANCSRICTIVEGSDALHFCDSRLEETIASTGSKLLIMDPIQAYLGADVDMHRANEIRPVMSRLEAIAEKHSCAVVLIGHMNKSGKKAQYKGLGSIDITAAARSVLFVGRRDNDKQKRCLIPIKSNLAPEGRAVLFSVGDRLTWEGFADLDINRICSDTGTDNKAQSKVEQAEFFLKELFDGTTEIRSTEVESKAKEHGICKRVLDTAKKNLHISSRKSGDYWFYVFHN
jgi:hypothetical protein